MAKFDDPTTWPADYAPGLHHPKGRKPAWRAPERYVQAGWTPARVEVPEGEETPVCRRLTRELLQWWAKQAPSAADFGTWAYVIRRYRTDDISPYAEVKQNTRDGYDYTCDAWDKAIGHWRIEDLTFERIKEIERKMREVGRSTAYIRRMFTQLRGLASYGSLLRETEDACTKVSQRLSKMRFKTPPSKSSFPTREQVMAIVDKADAAGDFLIATGWLLQFEMCLRAVDVRGQWLSDMGNPITGGITRNGRRWQDGLTWEMFDGDLARFSKVISKTERTMPEPYHFSMEDVPYLRDRFFRLREMGMREFRVPAETGAIERREIDVPSHRKTPEDFAALESARAQKGWDKPLSHKDTTVVRKAVGPVFVTRMGLPYDQTTWARVWAKHRAEAGVPEEVKVTDLRSGGLTEARMSGAQGFDLRDAGQHANITTTNRYVRDRSEAHGRVVKLRQEKRK